MGEHEGTGDTENKEKWTWKQTEIKEKWRDAQIMKSKDNLYLRKEKCQHGTRRNVSMGPVIK